MIPLSAKQNSLDSPFKYDSSRLGAGSGWIGFDGNDGKIGKQDKLKELVDLL